MSRNILVVDDVQLNRQILTRMLEQEYAVLEAENGETALKLLEQAKEPISAVLLDINMPGMNGYEVVRSIREADELAQIPVIMITGYEDDEAQSRSLEAGANDFVTKPYNRDVIRHCVANNIALREAAAKVQAFLHDKLTGLYNRDPFFERAQELLAAKEPGHYIMACFDVDNFKLVNDQYGMKKGDEVLKHIAHVFKKGFTPMGGLCSRISADTFAVLYPAAWQGTKELLDIREKATQIEGLIAPIIFSIGRYTVEDLTLAPSAMYDRANLAMSSVKGRYDNKIGIYDESMRQKLLKEQQIVQEMEHALKTRQFEAWFQPQYNHSTEAMIGAEALVRWRHPQRGLIPPYQFIPLFEENGFIYELDKYVWEEVCRCQRKWLDEGRHPLPVSVNISRYDVFCPDIIDVITGLVKKYNIPVDLLRLEITESAFSKSAKQIVEVVSALIENGFTVEIDDFGSGYSSLNTLKDVPAQIIKLDMKFLQSSTNSQRGGNIVESVVRMAKWLGMSVIAEGVETKEQADYLRSIRCSYIQGYLYAKPMPMEQYEQHCADSLKEEHLLALQTVEHLDNETFWAPDSIDTLIFNSFVGGACVFEYRNGSIELLRATQKYAQVIGSAEMDVETALKLDWSKHLDQANYQKICDDLNSSIATKEEVTGEYVFLDLPGAPHETYLRSTMRIIAATEERYLVYCTNENITAQRQAEKRENEAAAKMRLIMANVNSGICATIVKPDGKLEVLFANDRFYSMYGYTREQMEAELGSVTDAVYPEDLEQALAIVQDLLLHGGQATYEYRCIKRDGAVITVSASNTVTSFPGYESKVLLAVVTDVTDRLRSEQQLHALSDQMQLVMKNVNGGISATVIENGEQRIIFANDKYYSMLGYTKEQAQAELTSILDVVHPEDKNIAQNSLAALLATGTPNEVEYRCVKRDGGILYVRSSRSLTGMEGYGDQVIITVISDITALVLANQSERHIAAQLQSIMDNVDVGIVASRIKDGALHFLFSNDKYYTMRGYTREQYRAEVTDPYALIVPESQSMVRKKTLEITHSGESVVMEYELLGRDGERRYIRNAISIGRFEDLEDPVQLSIFRNITAAKEAEQREARANEQLRTILRDIQSGITATVLRQGKVEVLFSNEQFYTMHGLTKEEYRATVKDHFAFLHPMDLERIRKEADAVYQGSKPIRDEYRIVLGDGSIRWLRINMTRTHFTGIQEPVIVTIYDDITAGKNAELATIQALNQMRAMMDDMPGGYARLCLQPDGSLKTEYINEGFCKLLNMGSDEVMRLYGKNALNGVHPADAASAKAAVEKLLKDRELMQLRCRLLCSGGVYAWTNIVCRVTTDAQGNVHLNTYYTDAGKQIKTEEQQRALLDNLPGGAGVYELEDGQLHLIYQNKSYWELVGLNEAQFPDPAPLSAIHPDDTAAIMQELSMAIQQGRDLSCDIRLRHLTKGFRPVHLAGKITSTSPSKFTIYATFSPIPEQSLLNRKLMPLLLSAVMDSTTDLSFAKDTQFRYISASNAFARLVGARSSSDIIGRTDHDLFSKALADKYRADDAAMLESGEPLIDIVEPLPPVNGIPHYASTSKYLLKDGLGNVLGIYGVGRDITRNIAQSTRLDLVAETIPGGLASYVCTKGAFAPENIKIVYFSDGFCKLFGFTHEEYERRASVDPASLVFKEDHWILAEQWARMMEENAPINCTYRVHVKGGGCKWISHRAVVADHSGEKIVVNAVLQDVTEQRELIDRLYISEEENKLALALGENTVARFQIAERTLTLTPMAAAAHSLPQTIRDVPQEPLRLGLVAPESAAVYTAFFQSILHGSKSETAVFKQRYLGDWRWVRARSATVFSGDGTPIKAIISFTELPQEQIP